MNAVAALAANEFRLGLRNRWVALAVLLLAALALALALLGTAPAGTTGVDHLTATSVSLASLSIYLLPLIALLLAHDAIAGEQERGTLLLLLTYPMPRWQLLAGKFLGHAFVLVLATLIGYGLAALVLWGGSASGLTIFLRMLGSSLLLAFAFLAIGYAISALCTETSAAAGLALAAWLGLVLLYDLGLLGLLVADQGDWIGSRTLPVLLLANPADAYRLYNLVSLPDSAMLTGMAGLADQLALPAIMPLLALVAWTLAPLVLAARLLQRRTP
ncbi:MAG: ABC transporter permease subunit [Alphaproteobacteria bacterium]